METDYIALASQYADKIEKDNSKFYYSFTAESIELFANAVIKEKIDPQMDPAQR